MGSRSKARARAQANQTGGESSAAPRQQAQSRRPQPEAGSRQPLTRSSSPRTVQILAVIEAVEATGVLLASILAGIATGSGKSYHLASGIAITLIGIGTAIALGLVARGLLAGRRWTRTPTMLTQLFTGIVGIYLVQSARYDWGIPALLLTISGVAMLLAPASVKLLTPGRADKPGES